ncbi:MAG: endonuclease/exonuclease/phosphatase family protein [Tidjanibacter sp.]|nr:endonuclease/exonuclease/phosphatase family protein [Tidjanibacter sp.]
MKQTKQIILTFLLLTITMGVSGREGSFSLRVMSMNVKEGGQYIDYASAPYAEVIEAYNPDVVAMQEIDYMTDRNGYRDWFDEVAIGCDMLPYYCKSFTYRGGGFGVGLLSKYPFFYSNKHISVIEGSREPRAAGWICVALPCGEVVRVATTHLALESAEITIRNLADVQKTLFAEDTTTPTLLVGDFNSTPDSSPLTFARVTWQDIGAGTGFTIPTSNPNRRIDYVMGYPKGCWSYTEYQIVVRADLSDHCFVVADITFTPKNK